MNNRGQLSLRMIHLFQQVLHSVEAEVDLFRMEFKKAFQYLVRSTEHGRSGRFRLLGQQAQQLDQGVAHVITMDNHIDHAMFIEIF